MPDPNKNEEKNEQKEEETLNQNEMAAKTAPKKVTIEYKRRRQSLSSSALESLRSSMSKSPLSRSSTSKATLSSASVSSSSNTLSVNIKEILDGNGHYDDINLVKALLSENEKQRKKNAEFKSQFKKNVIHTVNGQQIILSHDLILREAKKEKGARYEVADFSDDKANLQVQIYRHKGILKIDHERLTWKRYNYDNLYKPKKRLTKRTEVSEEDKKRIEKLYEDTLSGLKPQGMKKPLFKLIEGSPKDNPTYEMFMTMRDFSKDTVASYTYPKQQRNTLDSATKVKIMGDMCEALAQLHKQDLVHGDIKDANITFNNMVVNIIDVDGMTPKQYKGEPCQFFTKKIPGDLIKETTLGKITNKKNGEEFVHDLNIERNVNYAYVSDGQKLLFVDKRIPIIKEMENMNDAALTEIKSIIQLENNHAKLLTPDELAKISSISLSASGLNKSIEYGGTSAYLAPELKPNAKVKPQATQPFTQESDVFAMAIVLTRFYTGQDATRENIKEVVASIADHRVNTLLNSMINENPAQRPSALQAYQRLMVISKELGSHLTVKNPTNAQKLPKANSLFFKSSKNKLNSLNDVRASYSSKVLLSSTVSPRLPSSSVNLSSLNTQSQDKSSASLHLSSRSMPANSTEVKIESSKMTPPRSSSKGIFKHLLPSSSLSSPSLSSLLSKQGKDKYNEVNDPKKESGQANINNPKEDAQPTRTEKNTEERQSKGSRINKSNTTNPSADTKTSSRKP